jgi:hypothetical protein
VSAGRPSSWAIEVVEVKVIYSCPIPIGTKGSSTTHFYIYMSMLKSYEVCSVCLLLKSWKLGASSLTFLLFKSL